MKTFENAPSPFDWAGELMRIAENDSLWQFHAALGSGLNARLSGARPDSLAGAPAQSDREIAFCLQLAEAAFGGSFTQGDVEVFSLERLSRADLDAAAALGRVCRFVVGGSRKAALAAVYAEPAFLPAGEAEIPEGGVRLRLDFAVSGRFSICGGDAAAVLAGVQKALGTRVVEPWDEIDAAAAVHPYYIRFSGDSAGWLDIVKQEDFAAGLITKPVSVKAVHGWAEYAGSEAHPVFTAGIF